jgi:hypothetical protein
MGFGKKVAHRRCVRRQLVERASRITLHGSRDAVELWG